MIATTDADTVVAPDWVAMTLAEITAGADAVAGRILVDPAGLARYDRETRACHLRDVTYRFLVSELEARLDPDPFDPWPRHFQHFGPSLAVTVDAYRRAGGMPPLPSLEDVAFYDALRRVDARIRHSPVVRVVTSARPEGRVGFGFAVQLHRWSEMGRRQEPFQVESLPAILARIRARRRLRRHWCAPTSADLAPVSALADDLGIDSGWLMREIGHRHPFGTLLQRVESCQRVVEPLVPIETAIDDLRRYLAPLRGTDSGSLPPLEQIQPVGLPTAAG